MRSISILISLSFFVLLEYTQVYGDVVHLKNGRLIEGEVIEETDNAVNLRTKIGKVVFQRNELESIEKRELPADFFESLQPRIKKKELTQPTEKKSGAEGYSEIKPPKFNLNINAEFKRLLEGDAILVNGTTNLPQKAVLYLIFKNHSQTITVRKEIIEGASFSVTIGPFGDKRIPPGSYIIEALFSPERQETERIKEMLADAKEIIATSNITVGSLDEAQNKATKRKSELAAQLKELENLFDELDDRYLTQKNNFNEGSWNAWSLKWQSRLNSIKSSFGDYRNKTLVLDFPAQENVLEEIIYDLELLWNRYTAELFKMNKLSFNVPLSNDNRNPDFLKKIIQERLETSKEFLAASKMGERSNP